MKLKTQEEIREYEAFLSRHPRGHLLQSYEWGKVKSQWINEFVIVRGENGEIKASLSILIRRMPVLPLAFLYAPRGPVCDLHDEASLRALTEGAKEIARRYKAITLKLDTDTSIEDTAYAQTMEKLGWRLNNKYSNLEGVQARFVFRVDIGGKTPEQIMAGFHSKTRYNIRVAQRHGVTVRVGTREDIPAFFALMQETGRRDGFVIRPLSYFYKLFDCLGAHQRLFIASVDGEDVAGAMAGAYGSKCLYLYGASANEHRQKMPAYLVQWEMMQYAREMGCSIYDLRGVPGVVEEDNPIYGLYRFKKGFGGDLCEFIGELDMVYKPFWFWAFKTAEKARKSLRKGISRMKKGK